MGEIRSRGALLLQELKNYRTLRRQDILGILRFGPSILRRRVSMVEIDPHYPLEMKKLRIKEGKVIILNLNDSSSHAVALFRAFDKYIYYDSSGDPIDETIAQQLQRMGVKANNIIQIATKLQSQKYASCTYHALAFLFFSIVSDHLPAKRIKKTFIRHLQKNADYVVVKSVERLVQNMPGTSRSILQCVSQRDSILEYPIR